MMSSRALYRDKYSGNYSDIANTKFNQSIEQNANIDIETCRRGLREIHLNIVPSVSSEIDKNCENTPPNINININIPSTANGNKPWCNGPNIILSYNKQENVQITISNNSKFKIKKMKQHRFAKLNRIVKFLALKKDTSVTDKGKCMENRNSTIQLNLQKILDDNFLYTNQNQKKYSVEECASSKLDFSESHKYLCDNESELDAYMRELKSRNESISDP